MNPDTSPALCHGAGSFPKCFTFSKEDQRWELLWLLWEERLCSGLSSLLTNSTGIPTYLIPTLLNPDPSGVPVPQRSPRVRIPRIPRSHTSTKHCLCSTPLELPLQRPCTAQTSAGSWFTRRGVLASQTSLPVHNTFPAIHNLIYVTIAPINNSVGQLRNYSLKGPELLFLPLPRPICLVSRLREASCPQVSPARQGWW